MAKRARARREGPRVVGYARVSTGPQAKHGVSLETQDEKIRSYCKLHDLELVDLKVDVMTGKVMRPVLQDCLDMIERGEVDGLVVWNLDRFARSVRDTSAMIERYFTEKGLGARLVSVTESIDTRSAGGRFVANVLASVHQWEAERLVERTRANMARLREHGYWTGGTVPYGYRACPREFTPDGKTLPRKLEEDPAEQKVIATVRELSTQGLSLRAIASELSRLRFRTRTAGSFSAQQVANILGREAARSTPVAG